MSTTEQTNTIRIDRFAYAAVLFVIGVLLAIGDYTLGFPSPNLFRVSFTLFFLAYAAVLGWLAIPAQRRSNRFGKWCMIAFTVFAFFGCDSTRQRSSASVHVNTSWGSYNRRPPGGKIADDRANWQTLWFRVITTGFWGAGLWLYLRVGLTVSAAAAVPQQRTPPPLPTKPRSDIVDPRTLVEPLSDASRFSAEDYFEHDSRYPGIAPPDRDLAMSLAAVCRDLRREGFADVTWKIEGETSYSCRTKDGRPFRFTAKPPVKPQITAAKKGTKCAFHVKVWREGEGKIAWTPEEQTSILKYAGDSVAIYLVAVVVMPPPNSHDGEMKNFRLDYRGAVFAGYGQPNGLSHS